MLFRSTFYFDVALKALNGQHQEWEPEIKFQRALIVDDNANNRFILEKMLAYINIESHSVSNGYEALELIKSSSFDVVLMDYQMPDMDGLNTAGIIRNELKKTASDLPILLLSSSSDDERIAQTCNELSIGINLAKPVKMHQLFDALSGIHQTDPRPALRLKPVSAQTKQIIFNKAIKIMIAEDNAVNMLLARSLFNMIFPNAMIIEASNGEQAIDKFRQYAPDIVFMDVQMPVMNGYEATAEIRKLESITRIPIIALTAGTVKGEKEKCLDAGMDDYISKPFVKNSIDLIFEKWMHQIFRQA